MATGPERNARKLCRGGGDPGPDPTLSDTPPPEVGDSAPAVALSCPTCGVELPAAAFMFVSPSYRLLGATCAGCGRCVLTTADRWQRLSGRMVLTGDPDAA